MTAPSGLTRAVLAFPLPDQAQLVPAAFVLAGWAAIVGTYSIGALSLSALTTLVLGTTCALWLALARPALRTSALVVGFGVALLTIWMVVAGVGSPYPFDLGSAQQTTTLLLLGAGIVIGGPLMTTADRLAVRGRLDRASKVLAGSMAGAFAIALVTSTSRPASPRLLGLAALIPLAWFLARWDSDDSPNRSWAIGTALLIVATLSRTAAACALLLVALALPRRTPRQRKLALVGVVGVLVLGYAAVSYWTPLRRRFVEGDVSLSIGPWTINASGRSRMWDHVLGGALEQPVTGWGIGSSRPYTRQLVPWLEHPHQDYLRIFFEGGGIALVIWLALLAAIGGVLLIGLLSHRGHHTDSRPFERAGMFALIVLAVSMLTDNTLAYVFMVVPAGLMIGLGLGATRGPSPRAGTGVAPMRSGRAAPADLGPMWRGTRP
jgi:O-antigen ligase